MCVAREWGGSEGGEVRLLDLGQQGRHVEGLGNGWSPITKKLLHQLKQTRQTRRNSHHNGGY